MLPASESNHVRNVYYIEVHYRILYIFFLNTYRIVYQIQNNGCKLYLQE